MHYYNINGIAIEQRDDGFINATALCLAHDRTINYWFYNYDTIFLFEALARELGLQVKQQGFKRWSACQLSTLYPELIDAKRGSPSKGGGTWLHPELAVYVASWCNAPLGLLLGRRLREAATKQLLHQVQEIPYAAN